MKVYVLGNPWHENGILIYREAVRQKKDVVMGLLTWPFKHIIREIKREKPNWIFLTGSRVYTPLQLSVLADLAKLAIWCPDDLDDERIQIWENLKGIPSVIFTTVTDLDKTLARDEVVWLPQYYDDIYYTSTTPLTSHYIYDICFFGSMDDKRIEWLEKLGKKYKLFKHDKYFDHRMVDIYRQSKLSFGIWRDGFSGGDFACSDRIFKAMGSGCCYLHHDVEKPELLFTPEVHFDIYLDTYEMLDEMIEYYLSKDKQREFIRIKGRAEILDKHTLKVRLPEYWKIMEKFE